MRLTNVAAVVACVLSVSMSNSVAQPRFEVPLVVTEGSAVQALFFGFYPGAHSCITTDDSMNGNQECSLPPPPPVGLAQFVESRTGTICCFGGSSCDFRPPTAPTQKDTFRVLCQVVEGANIVISWPAGLSAHFTQLILRYFDQNLGQNVNIDMLSDTTADVSAAGDPATVNIYSGGLVTSAGQASSVAPGEFSLAQNYPNPFNPSTTIKYALSPWERVSRQESGRVRVTLKVYDVLGREVSTLVNETQSPGRYSVVWSAAGVASGVYVYRLRSTNATITRKMLLMR